MAYYCSALRHTRGPYQSIPCESGERFGVGDVRQLPEWHALVATIDALVGRSREPQTPEDTMSQNAIPRRCQIEKMTEAERAILEAAWAVERMPAHAGRTR